MTADYWDVALAMAEARPNMRAETLVSLARAVVDGTKPLDLDDAQALGRWASLAQAKYALDTLPHAGWGAGA